MDCIDITSELKFLRDQSVKNSLVLSQINSHLLLLDKKIANLDETVDEIRKEQRKIDWGRLFSMILSLYQIFTGGTGGIIKKLNEILSLSNVIKKNTNDSLYAITRTSIKCDAIKKDTNDSLYAITRTSIKCDAIKKDTNDSLYAITRTSIKCDNILSNLSGNGGSGNGGVNWGQLLSLVGQIWKALVDGREFKIIKEMINRVEKKVTVLENRLYIVDVGIREVQNSLSKEFSKLFISLDYIKSGMNDLKGDLYIVNVKLGGLLHVLEVSSNEYSKQIRFILAAISDVNRHVKWSHTLLDFAESERQEILRRLGPWNWNTLLQLLTQIWGALSNGSKLDSINNDVQKVKKEIKEITDLLGVAEFPLDLPASFLTKWEVSADGKPQKLQEPGQIEIKTYSQLSVWLINRIDEVLGEFYIPINIEDSDLTKEGDQPLGLALPNIAESIAEIMGLMLKISTNTEALISLGTKNLIETISTKQIATKNWSISNSLIKYTGANYSDQKYSIPTLATIGASNLALFLKEDKVEVIGVSYKEKQTLKDNLIDFLHATAIIRGMGWRKFDRNNISAELLFLIKGYRDFANQTEQQTEDEKFEKFVSDVEVGFTNKPGNLDPLNPYCRPLDERPRITEIKEP